MDHAIMERIRGRKMMPNMDWSSRRRFSVGRDVALGVAWPNRLAAARRQGCEATRLIAQGRVASSQLHVPRFKPRTVCDVASPLAMPPRMTKRENIH
ncbi:hypothetical protein [Mesorhizobium sangaii]|uniref:Uncharacterized protein n=1 Tax=Mesorhizobium sangaii TaxID=505389 RepID=A0A841P1G1_9HYPH|nr:hypothetical protein [Mesorhizobium sangaii]MBB6409144.1 hypothetical protein [Mesorhizobium sangaii]